MKKMTICEFDPTRCFKSQEDARNWLLEDINKMEKLINTKIKDPFYPQKEISEFVRPDIYSGIGDSGKILVANINLNGKITNDDFKKFFATVAYNNASIAVWILADLDEKDQYIIDWINERFKHDKLELMILKLSAFQIENSDPILSLDRI